MELPSLPKRLRKTHTAVIFGCLFSLVGDSHFTRGRRGVIDCIYLRPLHPRSESAQFRSDRHSGSGTNKLYFPNSVQGLTSAVFGGTTSDLKKIYHMDLYGLQQIVVTKCVGTLFGMELSWIKTTRKPRGARLELLGDGASTL